MKNPEPFEPLSDKQKEEWVICPACAEPTHKTRDRSLTTGNLICPNRFCNRPLWKGPIT